MSSNVEPERLPRPVSRSASLLMWGGALAIIAMMVHICADVFSRRMFDQPIVGTLEYVVYLYMVAVVFLPLGKLQEERGHVSAEVLAQVVPERATAWMDRGAQLFTFVYTAFIGWWGAVEAVRSFTHNEVVTIIQTDIPLWPTRLLLPIGLGMMCIVILTQLAASFRPGGPKAPDANTADFRGH